MPKNNRLSVWACGLILTAAVLIGGSDVQAQSRWSDDGPEVPGAQSTPPQPPLQISGSFDGTVVDTKAGEGTINLTFTEKTGKTRATLRGTWTASYPDTSPEGAINDVGILRGTVVGSTVTLSLVPRRGDALGTCVLLFKSDEATADTLSGTFHFGICTGTNTGTISVQPGPAPTTVFINVGDSFFFPPNKPSAPAKP